MSNMSEYTLVKTDYNWADEANFPSFEILETTDVEQMKLEVEEYFTHVNERFKVWVGSNEYIEFESRKDIFRSYQERILSNAEYHAIKDTLGMSFGECPFSKVIEKMRDNISEWRYDNEGEEEDE